MPQSLAMLTPEFSYARNKLISVHKAVSSDTFPDLFHLPMSEEASHIFSSSKVYKTLVDHPATHLAFRWIWKCPCQPKHKVFSGCFSRISLALEISLEEGICSLKITTMFFVSWQQKRH
jgi:hypothetical protein